MPNASQDDTRPDDHKIKLDANDIRENKRAKSAAAGSGSAAKGGNAWSGFGGGSGGSGGGGSSTGRGAGSLSGATRQSSSSGVKFGGMRMSVTKKEALRSKGVFKIAPQSKVGRMCRWREQLFCVAFLEDFDVTEPWGDIGGVLCCNAE